MKELSDHTNTMLEVVGFRGSAKSTFGSLALILWAALEHPEIYDFIIPICDTSTQSKMNMANIKNELDSNWLLKNDYGHMHYSKVDDKSPEDPTLESDEDWQAQNVLLDNGVRILCRSRGQKVRGLKHRMSRPKLTVVDDPEDRDWVKTKENRDKTASWFLGEVVPARDVRMGRIIVIGNWLHEDALMARLKKMGIFKVLEYPLIKGDMLTWPALFPTQELLDKERQLMGEIPWRREMLMQIVPEDGQIITPNDIHYYDGEPSGSLDLIGHGVDLAISKKSTADFTTDVSGELRFDANISRHTLFIRPGPLNARLNFTETINHCVNQHRSGNEHIFFVEDVMYQRVAIQELERNLLSVTGMKRTTDKRAMLTVIAPYIRNGTVKFPRHGCEDLLAQLFGFGVETHDDLVDGLVNLVLGVVQSNLGITPIVVVRDHPTKRSDPLNEKPGVI